MKIYIAGKITGEKHYKRKFGKVERILKQKGHSVFNPATLDAYPEFTWEDYMSVTKAMLKRCNAMLLLPDWKYSKGAILEYEYAKKLGISVFFSLKDIPKNKN